MKEILVNESVNHPELVLQVFWGLLACEIINGKDRDVVENTSLRKMKDLIERKYDAQGINLLTSSHEHIETIAWLTHWLLVYSFTSDDLTNTGLFATILTNFSAYSTNFLNIVQMRSESLSKYMTTSFLLCRGQPNEKYQIDSNALEKHALPIALDQIKSGKKDPFALFLKAVYDDYDLDEALKLVEQMSTAANDDLLLRKYALDIKYHAYLLIFQMKCKLYKYVSTKEMSSAFGEQYNQAKDEIERQLSL